jgi:hypothetical protein
MIVGLLGCMLIGYLLFVDRRATRTYHAYVALEGKGPPGITGPTWDGPDTVVLYRTGRNDVICFDAFHSKQLHDRLSVKNGQTVTVEYDIFSDFGRVRRYNVHSVDGMIPANGYHVLREDFAATAGVARTGADSAVKNDCW